MLSPTLALRCPHCQHALALADIRDATTCPACQQVHGLPPAVADALALYERAIQQAVSDLVRAAPVPSASSSAPAPAAPPAFGPTRPGPANHLLAAPVHPTARLSIGPVLASQPAGSSGHAPKDTPQASAETLRAPVPAAASPGPATLSGQQAVEGLVDPAAAAPDSAPAAPGGAGFADLAAAPVDPAAPASDPAPTASPDRAAPAGDLPVPTASSALTVDSPVLTASSALTAGQPVPTASPALAAPVAPAAPVGDSPVPTASSALAAAPAGAPVPTASPGLDPAASARSAPVPPASPALDPAALSGPIPASSPAPAAGPVSSDTSPVSSGTVSSGTVSSGASPQPERADPAPRLSGDTLPGAPVAPSSSSLLSILYNRSGASLSTPSSAAGLAAPPGGLPDAPLLVAAVREPSADPAPTGTRDLIAAVRSVLPDRPDVAVPEPEGRIPAAALAVARQALLARHADERRQQQVRDSGPALFFPLILCVVLFMAGAWYVAVPFAALVLFLRLRREERGERFGAEIGRLADALGGQRLPSYDAISAWFDGLWPAPVSPEAMWTSHLHGAVRCEVHGYAALLDVHLNEKTAGGVVYPPRITAYLAAVWPGRVPTLRPTADLSPEAHARLARLRKAGYTVVADAHGGLVMRASESIAAEAREDTTRVPALQVPLGELADLARDLGAEPVSAP